MILVAQFDPSAAASGTFTVPQSSAAGKMVVYNESNISLKLSFQNGYTAYIPAWVAILFCGPFGNQVIGWSQEAILNSGSPPISLVIVETYQQGEPVPGTFPASLVRQTNIGNSIPLSTTATAIVNDGNAANTPIIEATVSGDASSAVKLTNDGKLTIGNATHPGQISLDDGTITSNGSGTLDAVNFVASTLLLSNGLLEAVGHSVLDNGAITTDGTGNMTLHTLTATTSVVSALLKALSSSLPIQDSSGNPIAQFIASPNSMNLTGTTQNFNGDTSGSMTLYEAITGAYSLAIVIQSNYQQAGAGQQFTLNNPFTVLAACLNLGCGGMNVFQNNVAQTVRVLTVLAAGGGTTVGQTAINTASLAYSTTPFNQVGNGGGYASAHTGLMILLGK